MRRRRAGDIGLFEGLALFVAAVCLVVAAAAIDRAVEAEKRAENAERAAELNGVAINANRLTQCAAARIVSFNPVEQFPHESDTRFRKRIGAYQNFLRLAARIDCKAVLTAFIEELGEQEAGGVDTTSGDSPSSQPSPGVPGPRGERGKPGEPGKDAPSPEPAPEPSEPDCIVSALGLCL